MGSAVDASIAYMVFAFQEQALYLSQFNAGCGQRDQGARVRFAIGSELRSAIRTRPERLMLLLGKTACGARASQTNRGGLRLQAQPGFAAPSCARRRPRKTPAPVPDADALPAFCMR